MKLIRTRPTLIIAKLRYLAWAAVLLGLYVAGRALGDASPLLMPPVGAILSALAEGIIEGSLIRQTGFSLLLIAAALGAATLAAFL